MRIACITTSRIPASTAHSIQAMKACHALAQVDGPVALWVPGDRPVAWEALAEHYGLETPFDVHWMPSRRTWRRYDFAWQALQEARRWGADLVYTWFFPAAALALHYHLPVVVEVHDRPSGRVGPWFLRNFVHTPGRKALLVITAALRGKLEEGFGLPAGADWVHIAPNGVDLEHYRSLPPAEEARAMLGLPPGLTVGYTGHFYAGRGAGLLVGLARAFPEVHFLWAGGRPEDVAAWREKLSAQGIENVTLTGFIDNRRLPLYQAAADVLLMPYERAIAGSSGGNSAEICSPMKMFDYLAAGRAIVSSDLPVLHEVLHPGNAVFCPPEDLPAWQAALAALRDDPELRRRLGAQAAADAARYTWRDRAARALAGLRATG
ncbi:MAG: glycosyltransferase family 4 protein [Chloroflexi bacterium]|nr:glycosyltransferase family 4 protein [Chloroflexota bacterium]